MKFSSCSLIAGIVFVAATPCFAEKNAKLKPALVAPGNVVLKDAFSAKALGKRWAVNKGAFEIVNGVVAGREKTTDKHAAVLTCKVPNRNSAIRFSFKLGTTKAFHLSFNKKRGHLFRVIVTRNGIVLRTDKANRKSKTKPVVLAKSANKVAADQWYTMLVEVRRNDVAVQVDNGTTLTGSHSSLDVDKPNYRFIVRGKTFRLDDVTIWTAKP
ncbi:MAG: hypothetical protein ACE5KM_20615 [Planctomycetaceae bacterium]